MIALVRKNLACFISNHNSFVCKANGSFSVSIRLFSTWRERQLAKSSRLYDILVDKHHFSPKLALLAASALTRFRKPRKADSVLSFLKENGFSSTQMERIVKYDPRILTASVEDIIFKIKIFQDLGLSSEHIAKLVPSNQVILHLRVKNMIIPRLSLLKGLLGSNYEVARLLKKSGWFLPVDFDKDISHKRNG